MTIEEAIGWGKTQISSDSAKLDCELLLAHTLGQPTSFLLTWPEKNLSDAQRQSFKSLVEKRRQGHPIAHLVGQREFWGLNFQVTANTLIPRPDTEVLVETVLAKMKKQQTWEFLDMGTGSGAIACAVKHEYPNANISATDLQIEALTIAKRNADQLNLDIQFIQSDWFAKLEQRKFDCIVSNPPYIENDDPHLQQGDVRFEPITALSSGKDGLDDLRQIIRQAPQHLNHRAWLILEHGYNQAEAVSELMHQAGFQSVELTYDYGQNPRVTSGQWLTTN